MRIISQDKNIDIPYTGTVIQIEEAGDMVELSGTLTECGKKYLLGKFATRKQACSAMAQILEDFQMGEWMSVIR